MTSVLLLFAYVWFAFLFDDGFELCCFGIEYSNLHVLLNCVVLLCYIMMDL